MDKGWGLTLDSDPINFFSSNNNNPAASVNSLVKVKRNFDTVGGGDSTRMFQFPVNLSGKEEQPAPSPADENRLVVGEVDFFSDKKRVEDDSKTTSFIVKKESSHGEMPPRSSLDVNVRKPSIAMCVIIAILDCFYLVIFLEIELLIFLNIFWLILNIDSFAPSHC